MKIRSALIAAAAISAIAGPASAQALDSAEGTADVKVKFLTPITITATSATALDFGTLVRSGTGAGSIVVTRAGARGTVTDLTAVTASTVSAASFTVNGTPSETISVSAAVTGMPSGVTVTPNFGDASQTLGSDGSLTLPVGGTLAVASGTANSAIAGSHTGTMTVTVAYP